MPPSPNSSCSSPMSARPSIPSFARCSRAPAGSSFSVIATGSITASIATPGCGNRTSLSSGGSFAALGASAAATLSPARSRTPLSSAKPHTPAPPVPTSRSVEGAAQVAPLPRPTYQDWIAENEPDSAALATQRESARSMPYQPLVSVLLPVYRIPFPILRACVRSVLDQTYPAWELCIAHGDPQATEHRAFLTALAATDKRVKLVLLDENGGISANSNVALNLASGEFVALLDHDDTLAPFAS